MASFGWLYERVRSCGFSSRQCDKFASNRAELPFGHRSNTGISADCSPKVAARCSNMIVFSGNQKAVYAGALEYSECSETEKRIYCVSRFSCAIVSGVSAGNCRGVLFFVWPAPACRRAFRSCDVMCTKVVVPSLSCAAVPHCSKQASQD